MPKRLPDAAARSPWYVLLPQFKGMLILLGAVALVASVGDTNRGDNLNAASANTIVTFGRGELVMTATGAQSEWDTCRRNWRHPKRRLTAVPLHVQSDLMVRPSPPRRVTTMWQRPRSLLLAESCRDGRWPTW